MSEFVRIRTHISLDAIEHECLDNDQIGVVFKLYSVIGRQAVEGYYRAKSDDPKLPFEQQRLANICLVSKQKFAKVFPSVVSYFQVQGGHIRLKNWDWVTFSIENQNTRKNISDAIKEIAIKRQGRFCIYCGDTAGPFEFDHLFPVSRGGDNSPNNIVMACKPCNRSKRANTVKEWMGKQL